MPDSDLSNPAFTDEDKARKVIENVRWANGVVCPFCGQLDTVRSLAENLWVQAGTIADPAATSLRSAPERYTSVVTFHCTNGCWRLI